MLLVCYSLIGCSIYDSELLGRPGTQSDQATTSKPWTAPESARTDASLVERAEASALDAPLLDTDTDAGPGPDFGKPARAADASSDAPDAPLSEDACPNDPQKTAPGVCGCGVTDTDYDSDTLLDCQDPAPHGWLRKLTFDGEQVPGSLEDFPLLVHVTDAHLGVFAAMNGQDIHFLAADGSSVLEHEIEHFEPARGELTAWVRAPRLERANDPVLYLAYSDGQVHRALADNVWSGYHHVWHLTDNLGESDAPVRDSTGHAHAIAKGAMTAQSSVAGIAGSAIQFDGLDDELVFENDLTGDTPSTIQAWVIQRQVPRGSLGSSVLMLGEQSADGARFLLSQSVDSGSAVRYGFYGNDAGYVGIASDVWRHLVWTWDGGRSSVFINGELVEGPIAHTGANTRGTSGRIGSTSFEAPRYDFFMSGVLDEVRVSTVARSSAWIATEYANQRPGSTFLKAIAEPEAAR